MHQPIRTKNNYPYSKIAKLHGICMEDSIEIVGRCPLVHK
jgi:hypothetical protein